MIELLIVEEDNYLLFLASRIAFSLFLYAFLKSSVSFSGSMRSSMYATTFFSCKIIVLVLKKIGSLLMLAVKIASVCTYYSVNGEQ